MAVLAVSLRASYLRCSSQPLSAGDQQRELQLFGLMCTFVTNHICHSHNILRGQIKAHWYFIWPISTEHVTNYTNFHIVNVVWCRIRAVILLKFFISDIKINCTVVASCIIRCSSIQKMLQQTGSHSVTLNVLLTISTQSQFCEGALAGSILTVMANDKNMVICVLRLD